MVFSELKSVTTQLCVHSPFKFSILAHECLYNRVRSSPHQKQIKVNGALTAVIYTSQWTMELHNIYYTVSQENWEVTNLLSEILYVCVCVCVNTV